jgi:dihydrofolate reductase
MRAIAAMDPNRVIGFKGQLPWHYKEDFRFFKKQTEHNVLVMGRTTFDLVGSLPNRFTYVLTNDPERLSTKTQAQVETLDAPSGKALVGIDYAYITGEQLRDMCVDYPGRTGYFWVCGGAKVYQEFLPLCSEIYVTHIVDEYEGDVYMPEFEHMFPNPEIVLETRDLMIAHYTR